MNLRKSSRFLFSIVAGVLYGLFVRLVFGLPQKSYLSMLFSVMTVGFIVFVPIAMGWITVFYAEHDGENHWVEWIFSSWGAVLLCDLGMLVTRCEGWICILMALPITLTFATVGGLIAGISQRNKIAQKRSTTLCLALLPFLIAGIEAKLSAPLQIRTVETSILIHAPAETIWRNIERVPAIRHDEIQPTWTHRIGFPLPVEATLSHEGIGGVRHASFEGGLLFIETINRWEKNQRISFTIAADTAHIPPTTLDEHVTIGGRYFDVLNGEYRLETRPNGDILLHLSSQERLSTDFNVYAALWTDAVMRDLQQSILEVVKHRCEAESSAVSATLKP